MSVTTLTKVRSMVRSWRTGDANPLAVLDELDQLLDEDVPLHGQGEVEGKTLDEMAKIAMDTAKYDDGSGVAEIENWHEIVEAVDRYAVEHDQKAKAERWYIGAMNDALFIINRPPRPSTDDVWHDRPDGPTLMLKTWPLKADEVQAIVDAHNANLSVEHNPKVKALREAAANLLDTHPDEITAMLRATCHLQESLEALAATQGDT